MALADHIGLTGPKFEVDIERGKIREFARAMSAPLPEFMTGANPIIPAMFLVSAPYTWGYTLERPRGTVFEKIGHNPAVSLHAEESFRFHGPLLRAGDRLTAVAKLEDVREKQGASGGELTFLTTLIEYRDKDGTLRAEQRTVGVVTADTPGSGEWSYDLPTYEPQYSSLDPRTPFAILKRSTFEDLQDGLGPGPVDAGPLTMQDIIRFQGVVGEDDPLHHDRKWAEQNGYPEVFGLGTYHASMMCSYAAHWIAPETVRSFKVRFCDVRWPGDRLSYEGKVISVDHAERLATLYLTCARANGDVVDEAWMECDFNAQ